MTVLFGCISLHQSYGITCMQLIVIAFILYFARSLNTMLHLSFFVLENGWWTDCRNPQAQENTCDFVQTHGWDNGLLGAMEA